MVNIRESAESPGRSTGTCGSNASSTDHVLQRKYHIRKLLGAHSLVLSQWLQELDHFPPLLFLEYTRHHGLDRQEWVGEQSVYILQSKPADVRAVENAGILPRPATEDQLEKHAPMLDIGDRGDQATTWLQPARRLVHRRFCAYRCSRTSPKMMQSKPAVGRHALSEAFCSQSVSRRDSSAQHGRVEASPRLTLPQQYQRLCNQTQDFFSNSPSETTRAAAEFTKSNRITVDEFKNRGLKPS